MPEYVPQYAFLVDEKSRQLMKMDTKTGEKTVMTEAECRKKFRPHNGCGGWFMHMLDPHTFHISSECTKCGMKEDKNKKCDKCVE